MEIEEIVLRSWFRLAGCAEVLLSRGEQKKRKFANSACLIKYRVGHIDYVIRVKPRPTQNKLAGQTFNMPVLNPYQLFENVYNLFPFYSTLHGLGVVLPPVSVMVTFFSCTVSAGKSVFRHSHAFHQT